MAMGRKRHDIVSRGSSFQDGEKGGGLARPVDCQEALDVEESRLWPVPGERSG